MPLRAHRSAPVVVAGCFRSEVTTEILETVKRLRLKLAKVVAARCDEAHVFSFPYAVVNAMCPTYHMDGGVGEFGP